VYLFRPKKSELESYRYSVLQNVEIVQGIAKSEFILTYSLCQNCLSSSLEFDNYAQAIVHISILDQFNVLDVDVSLYGLPNNRLNGHEVTVNFEAKDFDN